MGTAASCNMLRFTLLVVAALCLLKESFGFMSPALPATSLALGQKLPCMAPRRPAAASLSMVDIRVEVNEGEPIESALRRFKMAVSKSGHLMELKRRRTFETNNEKMIRKNKEAMRKRRMAKRAQRDF